jgi:hypothetical protein
MDKQKHRQRSRQRTLAALATVLTLGACASQPNAPTAETGEPDPVSLGHSQWCDTNPPSGYCDIDDHR